VSDSSHPSRSPASVVQLIQSPRCRLCLRVCEPCLDCVILDRIPDCDLPSEKLLHDSFNDRDEHRIVVSGQLDGRPLCFAVVGLVSCYQQTRIEGQQTLKNPLTVTDESRERRPEEYEPMARLRSRHGLVSTNRRMGTVSSPELSIVRECDGWSFEDLSRMVPTTFQMC
jgi:hypothetical protein